MKNDCVFCDRTQFEERLIAETDEHHIIATLGQIERGYVLIAPKEHVSCMGALTPEQTSPMLKITAKTCRALSLEYQHSTSTTLYPVTIFEHGIVGQTIKHAHLHILPIVIDFTPKIRADFPIAEIEEVQYGGHLSKLYAKLPQPYLFWSVPRGKPMVCWNPPAPSQYLRIIAAELLGRPERANWRAMDSELDKQLWSGTVTRLKPYFS
ncbi:MAG: HIT family protein [Candidatus Liptonbacteria bacterium]|nr:HIT family protein [Candidatus Liptonbacteria bacterium]